MRFSVLCSFSLTALASGDLIPNSGQEETLERGKGNTIEDIIKYWGNMNIEEIHYRVVAWKKQLKPA